MAIKAAFSPEMMAQLDAKEGFLKQGAKAVSAFEKFPGPNGDWFAMLGRINWSKDKKTNCFKCVVSFVIMAYRDNNSQEFAGRIVSFNNFLKESKNQTEQESWERLFVNVYQGLGCVTAAWAAMAQQRGVPLKQILMEETDRLNNNPVPVLLNISDSNDPRFKNINIREVLHPDALKHLVKPQVNITDEQYQEAADAEGNEETVVEDTGVSDFQKQFEQVESHINSLSMETLLVTATKSNFPINTESVAKMPIEEARRIVIRLFLQSQGKDPAEFGYAEKTSSAETITAADVGTLNMSEAGSVVVSDYVPEEDPAVEVEEVAETEEISKLPYLNSKLATFTRNQLKLGILKYDATAKFSPKQTDDDIRGSLLQLMLNDPSLTVPF